MLALFKNEFETILNTSTGEKQSRLLANLMSKMESHYKIPMLKERFEKEIAADIREFYLIVSNARNL